MQQTAYNEEQELSRRWPQHHTLLNVIGHILVYPVVWNKYSSWRVEKFLLRFNVYKVYYINFVSLLIFFFLSSYLFRMFSPLSRSLNKRHTQFNPYVLDLNKISALQAWLNLASPALVMSMTNCTRTPTSMIKMTMIHHIRNWKNSNHKGPATD